MAKGDFLFTSESVSEGHPDKVCDQISDTVVDIYLAADPMSHLGVETLATTQRVVMAGEVRGPGSITKDQLIDAARQRIKAIGYEQEGFHWKTAEVECIIHAQSVDIAQGVDAAGNKDEGAGDQGIMFGYACTETPELMPAPLQYSQQILKSMADARHSGTTPDFGPDAKSQVTLQYVNGKPVKATSVVVSTQHSEKVSQEQVREIVRPHVLKILPKGWMCDEEHFYVNPTGRFVIGGPDGDAGVTGRKIIVDTYGGAAPHGGGAFSGKDPSKVDRSAAYAMRWVAKNVVAAAHSPATSAGPRTPSPAEPNSSGTFSTAAAKITGVASRKPKRAASSLESPAKRPPPIVKPEREMPGIKAAACDVPTAIAWRQPSLARRASTSPA